MEIGGVIGNDASKNTDFLVASQHDYLVVGDYRMSSKQEAAIKLIEKGLPLEIISEQEIMRNI